MAWKGSVPLKVLDGLMSHLSKMSKNDIVLKVKLSFWWRQLKALKEIFCENQCLNKAADLLTAGGRVRRIGKEYMIIYLQLSLSQVTCQILLGIWTEQGIRPPKQSSEEGHLFVAFDIYT